jgi:hypothetical protein
MRALLILASLLMACETTWQAHQGPNQAPELTATRRVFTFYMIKTVSVPATLTLDPKDDRKKIRRSVCPGCERAEREWIAKHPDDQWAKTFGP